MNYLLKVLLFNNLHQNTQIRSVETMIQLSEKIEVKITEARVFLEFECLNWGSLIYCKKKFNALRMTYGLVDNASGVSCRSTR